MNSSLSRPRAIDVPIDHHQSDLATLIACPALAALAEEERTRVIQSAATLAVQTGEVIVRQGEPGDAFFVVLAGRVEVSRKEKTGQTLQLAALEPGDYFGEQSLIATSSGHRKASVVALEPGRVARIPATVFAHDIASAAQNRDAFERDASGYLFNRLRRSIESYVSSTPNDSRAGIDHCRFAEGETIIRQGAPSDAAYLIIDGVAGITRGNGDQTCELALLGKGQVFGEFGVLRNEPRTATVTARSALRALRIGAAQFRAWHDANEYLGEFVSSFTDVYTLSETRRVNVFRGCVEGEEAISTICGSPQGKIVSTRLLKRGVLVFANTAAETIAGPRDSVRYQDGDKRRELRLIVRQRSAKGIERAIVHGLEASQLGSDIGTLYRSVTELQTVTGRELRRFRLTGFLGGDPRRADLLCSCLGLCNRDIAAAAEEVGDGFDELQLNFGVGTLCGGCEPGIRSFLRQNARPQAPAAQPSACPFNPRADATGVERPEPAPDRDERWLARMLAPWAGDGSGHIGRQTVALRLRGLGTQHLERFIDALFGAALSAGQRLTPAHLANAVANADIGFAPLGPPPEQRARWGRALFWRVRKCPLYPALLLALPLLAGVSALALLSTAVPLAGLFAGLLLGSLGVRQLARRQSTRFAMHFITGGLESYYHALFDVAGRETGYVQLRPFGPLGKTLTVLRDEAMINRVLENPDIYSRSYLIGYPPFGVHSVLGSGTTGKWLGLRAMCEEYFVEGFRDDLETIAELTRQRVARWLELGEIDLLDELYRIIVEVRGQVFFQTSFGCFDADAPLDMARLVDDVLSPPIAFYGSAGKGENATLYRVIREAVTQSTRDGSVGKTLRDHYESGALSELEMLESSALFLLAQAPTMGLFWTLYRTARDGSSQQLRTQKGALVQALKEELRIHPAVTSLLTRTTTRADRNGELSLPKGAEVFISPLYVHANPALWRDPDRFQPEHWTVRWDDARDLIDPLTDAADAARRPVARADGQAPMRYFPFGAGPQACQARHFAPDEMLTVLRTVIGMVDLEVIEDHGLLERPLAERIRFHAYTRPLHDVRLRVSPAAVPAVREVL